MKKCFVVFCFILLIGCTKENSPEKDVDIYGYDAEIFSFVKSSDDPYKEKLNRQYILTVKDIQLDENVFYDFLKPYYNDYDGKDNGLRDFEITSETKIYTQTGNQRNLVGASELTIGSKVKVWIYVAPENTQVVVASEVIIMRP
ncbi:hypothetical protein V1503_19100 [Bacillus sp. SCS-151]|uniref:hypothetical protein n=1 Tax=Nanhaiella sioensis TaxID=3115293 RepID=UPI00397933DF